MDVTAHILDCNGWLKRVGLAGELQPGFADSYIVVHVDGRAHLARTAEDAAREIAAILAVTPSDMRLRFELDIPARLAGALQEALRSAGVLPMPAEGGMLPMAASHTLH